jgi:hypothetical protein
MPRTPAKPAKPAAQARKPAKPAAQARKPAKPAAQARKPAKPAPVDDLLDATPTPAIPGVYIGEFKRTLLRTCIAYKRDEHNVWSVMINPNNGRRILHKWGVNTFDQHMERAKYPHVTGVIYPLSRAVNQYLSSGSAYDDGAYRVLIKLSKGQDPDTEDTLDDLLDMTPSAVPRHRPARNRTPAMRNERKAKRKARLQAMTPAAFKAWRDKRNAARKLRRANAKKGASK